MSRERRKQQAEKRRQERRSRKLASRRRKREESQQLARWQKDRQRKDARKGDAGTQTTDVVVPPRNSPCPMHPEYKLKKCPHGCESMFRRMRDRELGTVRMVRVDADDDRRGRLGVETDGTGAARDYLSRIQRGERGA